MARVQNTQQMEMEDNEKKAEDDLTKQRIELASTKREMKANKKQWQRTFAEFQKQLEEKLKEVPRENQRSIRSLANQLLMTINQRTQKETQINPRMELLWKHQVL
jgi:hypothetical protein